MEQYGNLPLIEPLEYKEVNRLEELVIAIDTSGSCSKELVRRFLGETYQILSTRENFFKKMKYILSNVTVVFSGTGDPFRGRMERIYAEDNHTGTGWNRFQACF